MVCSLYVMHISGLLFSQFRCPYWCFYIISIILAYCTWKTNIYFKIFVEHCGGSTKKIKKTPWSFMSAFNCIMMVRWINKQPGMQKSWNLCCHYWDIYDWNHWIYPFNNSSHISHRRTFYKISQSSCHWIHFFSQGSRTLKYTCSWNIILSADFFFIPSCE